MRVARLLPLLFLSCAPSGFKDPTQIESVRIFASSADQPYAKPGATVNLSVLAYDGRAPQPAPMTIYWLPIVCENPRDDLYYACFQNLAGRGGGGADAGAPDGGAGRGSLPVGKDLTPFLPTGSSYSFQMPADAIATHATNPGTPVPYGLAILFNVACAGHLEILPFDPGNSNPQQVPLGCFDASGNQLGPGDYVFGFTRVYAYDSITNANPVIDHVEVEGQTLDLGIGFTTVRCTAERREQCAHVKVGPVVPPSSQEDNPEDVDDKGVMRKEEVWADYYSTLGTFTADARLLYDATTGALTETENEFLPPNEAGAGTMWIVVHDNRGGTSWATIPVHVIDPP